MSLDAMKQALEALERLGGLLTHKEVAVHAALRLAIEQAERQEPVAWVCEGSSSDEKHAIDYQQEDVDAIPIGTILYTAPPQLQPLTDEQLKPIADEYRILFGGWVVDFARAIERKHGIGGGE